MNPLLLAIPVALLAAVVVRTASAPTLTGSELPRKKAKLRDFDLKIDIDPKATYPESVREFAKRWSAVFDVPVAWIVSQAYVESKFKPLAVNPSGATGVLQLKLPRAKDLVRWIGRSKFASNEDVKDVLARKWHGKKDDLLDMELNTMLATFDLRRLRGKFGNDHRIVAAAYNQGEGAVGRALESGKAIPPRGLEYVARVEDAKSRGYV